MAIRMRFCGAARTVTGSCYLVEAPACRFLVDCGLFQGSKTLKELNYRPFPFDPAGIDFVLQTHAHIDHAGLLPKLVKDGLRGPVLMTRGTRDLLSFMLPDSGHIQEIEVEQLNRRNERRGRPPVVPIYTESDARNCESRFETVEYERWLEPGRGVRTRFWNAGHILGSASIEVEIGTGAENGVPLRLLFSGDIGPDHKLFHPDPHAPAGFDYVIAESTYGGRARTHATPDERRLILAREVKEALRAEGMLLIPIFAVERTQELIADLIRLEEMGAIPRVPLFLDSPLAIEVTKVFERHVGELEDLGGRASLLANPMIHPALTSDDSRRLDRVQGGAIIMAASGMCEAGRIRHHLKRWLWHRGATVLFVGYQAEGTLGRVLVDGATAVKIQSQDIKVEARIRSIDVYSGHADHGELVDWIVERQPIRRALYLTHGEEAAMTALTAALVKRGLDPARIVSPVLDDESDLDGGLAAPRERAVKRRIAPEAVGHPDWHNDLAEISLDLRAALEACADDRARGVVLRRVRRALKGEV